MTGQRPILMILLFQSIKNGIFITFVVIIRAVEPTLAAKMMIKKDNIESNVMLIQIWRIVIARAIA